MMTLLFVAHFENAPNDFKVRLFSENLKIEDWESISWTKHDKPYYLEGHDIMCTLKFIMASIFHKLTWFSINLDVDTQARGKTLRFQNLLIQIFLVFSHWQIPNCTRIIWIRIYVSNFLQHLSLQDFSEFCLWVCIVCNEPRFEEWILNICHNHHNCWMWKRFSKV